MMFELQDIHYLDFYNIGKQHICLKIVCKYQIAFRYDIINNRLFYETVILQTKVAEGIEDSLSYLKTRFCIDEYYKIECKLFAYLN